jgi:O-antigen ligase
MEAAINNTRHLGTIETGTKPGRRWGIVFHVLLPVLLIVFLWNMTPLNPVTMVLITIGVLLLLSFKKPVWAITAFLLSQFTISSYMVSTPIGPVSLRLLLLIITTLILWRTFATGKMRLGPQARYILVPTLLLLGVTIAANMANTGMDFVFKDMRNMIVGVLVIVLTAAATRNVNDLKIICGTALIIITASSIIGLLQYYQFLGLGQRILIPGYADTMRIPGMAESTLDFAFTLPLVILTVLGVSLTKGVRGTATMILVMSAVLMGLALYFTYTRSSLGALAFGAVALVLLLRTRIKGELILAALLAAVAFISITGNLDNASLGGREEGIQEKSSLSRQILWQAGIAIAMDNPILGIGGDRFKTVSVEYRSSVDPELRAWEEEAYWGYSAIGNEQPHNDFLKMWVSYGTLALVLYIWLYFVFLKNLLLSYRTSNKRFIKGVSVGLAAALVAYGVNAFFHNSFATLPLFWIVGGLSLATTKLAINGTNQSIKTRDNNNINNNVKPSAETA